MRDGRHLNLMTAAAGSSAQIESMSCCQSSGAASDRSVASFGFKAYERRDIPGAAADMEQYKIQNLLLACGPWFHAPEEQRPRIVPGEGKEARA